MPGPVVQPQHEGQCGPDEDALVIRADAGFIEEGGGTGSYTAGMPWMTAQDAASGEITAAHEAVMLESLACGVAGAARIETAVRPEHAGPTEA